MRHHCVLRGILLLCLLPFTIQGFAKESKDVDIRYLHRMRGPDRERFDALSDTDPAGLIVSLRGLSYILRSKKALQTKLRAPVFVDDGLRTERAASLKVAFLDQSILSLAGDTEVVIRDYLYGEPEEVARIFVEKGVMEFMAGELSKVAPQDFHIETATATIGIRGSGGVVRVVPTEDAGDPWVELATKRGHVLEVWTKSGAYALIDNPLLGIRVSPGGSIFPLALPAGYFTQPMPEQRVVVLPVAGRTRIPRRPSQPLNESQVQQFAAVRGRGRRRSLDQRLVELAVDTFAEVETVSEAFSWEAHSVMKKEEMDMRDEELARERPSAMPLMQRLAEEQQAKGKKIDKSKRLTQEQCNKESASSLPILQQLGQEIQAKEAQKSKAEIEGDLAD